jgi:uncharacterized protein YggT (Ycf19 family)
MREAPGLNPIGYIDFSEVKHALLLQLIDGILTRFCAVKLKY